MKMSGTFALFTALVALNGVAEACLPNAKPEPEPGPVETLQDPNGYATYKVGDYNLILVCPHDGYLTPTSISDRHDGCLDGSDCIYDHTCSPTTSDCKVRTDNDAFTREITELVAKRVEDLTNKYPHVVYNNLKRTKMDGNREINEAAFDNPDAIAGFNAFHGFIAEAKANVGTGLLIDLHGMTHKMENGTEYTELGYTITKTDLNSGDYNAGYSSIKILGLKECGIDDTCFKELIYGQAAGTSEKRSLGDFMSTGTGYPVVPSPAINSPGSLYYYKGGYNVETYGSKFTGTIDAIQVEMPRLERWMPDLRELYAHNLAQAIVSFMDEYY